MNDPRGSVWRKWDLHFHTPASYDYGNGGVSNNDIVDGLVAAGVRVVAITDHHTIDVERILALRALAKDKLTVLPGIELRSDQGGDPIHYIGLFPEDCDVNNVWIRIQGRLGLTDLEIAAAGGDDKVYVPLEDAAPLFRELGGLVSIHAGAKSNSIESIKNREQFQQRIKYDITRDHIDIMEIGQIKDVAVHRDMIFPKTGLNRPLIICSDNHDVTSYVQKAACWIKADPTLRGLRQLVHECDERVFIGERPPKREEAKRHSTKYISAITIKKIDGSVIPEHWFDGTVSMNHDLVAIIGRKGSGKSALADIIGLCCGAVHHAEFSFLSTKKFCHAKSGKADHFEASIQWASSDVSVKKRLSAGVGRDDAERVKYIPQNYLERICNEFMEESPFDKELKAVIYSHVDTAERRGKASLDELVEYLTEATESRLSTLRKELREINVLVARLEHQASGEHRDAVVKAIALKEEELLAHSKHEPAPVAEPAGDAAEAVGLVAAVATARADLELVNTEIKAIQKKQGEEALKSSAAQRITQQVGNFEKEFAAFGEKMAADLTALGLKLDDVINLKVNLDSVRSKETASLKERADALQLLRPENEFGLDHKRRKLDERLQSLQQKLDGPNKAYQAFLSAKGLWETQRAEIIGGVETVNSLEYHKAALKNLDALPAEAAAIREKRREKLDQIFLSIASLVANYKKLYLPVQEMVEKHPLVRDKFRLNFQVSVVELNLEAAFFKLIHQGRIGSFSGKDEGRVRLRRILERADFTTSGGVAAFVNEVLEHLQVDKRDGYGKPTRLTDQMLGGHKPEEVYDLLFSLDYLRPRYMLRLGEKELAQLSPGERGTLLLMFYLLVDRDNIPLIIDQPEENLDNQTVHELLVPCIKEAKKRRQLILVTHNPNLAVVCDAEQIIHASLDATDGNRIAYVTGGLERPEINRQVLDILEGTRPAFDNRDAKYFAGTV